MTFSFTLGFGIMSDRELIHEFEKLDLDGDGVINPDEFDESLK